MTPRTTRRELMAGTVAAAVGGAGALGGAAAVGGAGLGLGAGVAAADTSPPSDSDLLSKALEVERLMVLAYRRVLAAGALTPGVRRVVAPFLGHELSHLAAVAAQLRRLGAPASPAPLDLKAAQALLASHHVSDSLSDLRTEDRCLKLLIDLESVNEGAFYTPLKDLRRPGLVRLSAQIMACEAQHWTVLSGLRNPGDYVKAVPWPYVFGSK